jgi:competence ComEA-like helix-hairpin-helix protein
MIGRLAFSSAWAFGAILWILVFVDSHNANRLVRFIPGACSAESMGMIVDSIAVYDTSVKSITDSSALQENGASPASTITPNSSPNTQPCINVNTADQQELMKLPGIGTVLAERIIAYRAGNKTFKSPQDLRSIKGIGEKKLAKIRNLICF